MELSAKIVLLCIIVSQNMSLEKEGNFDFYIMFLIYFIVFVVILMIS